MDWKTWWIAENAYYRWLEAGCPDNRSDEFWFAAERAYEDWLRTQGVKEPEWETTNERTVVWNEAQSKHLRERLGWDK